jgi:predicted transcriptional regulator
MGGGAPCAHCVQETIVTEPLTLRLDAETRKRLDRLAKRTDRSRAALAAEAVVQFVETNEWQIAAIEEGVRAADNNQFIDHARLKAKWEKKLAAALVKTR